MFSASAAHRERQAGAAEVGCVFGWAGCSQGWMLPQCPAEPTQPATLSSANPRVLGLFASLSDTKQLSNNPFSSLGSCFLFPEWYKPVQVEWCKSGCNKHASKFPSIEKVEVPDGISGKAHPLLFTVQ